MTNSSGVDISHSQVNVGGHIISTNISVPSPPQDIPVDELQRRLSRERNKIIQFESELEEAAYKGYSLDSSVVKAIVINALHAKRLIEMLIQTLMFRGQEAAYTWNDIEIGDTLSRAYERGEEKRLEEENQEQRRRKRKQLRVAFGISILVLPVLIAFVIIPTFTALSHFFSTFEVPSSFAASTTPSQRSFDQNSEPYVPQPSYIEQQMYVAALGLNVRAEPNPDAKILGKLTQGEIVVVLNEFSSQNGRWVMIRREKSNQQEQLEGWVNAKYLAPSLP